MSRINAAAGKASTSSGARRVEPDHFQLFGLTPSFVLDGAALERAYREIQSRVHPDRFAHAGDAERRASLQWTTRVNEAFRVLKNPVTRASHLLALHGVDVAFETNTAMPEDFLMRQMELREALEQAGDARALDDLKELLDDEQGLLERQLGEAIDERKDYAGAAALVRKLQFLDKLASEIDAAYETVNDSP